MSRIFNTWRDPYDRGFSVNKKVIEIEEGVTILVGCNGYGKSTLIRNIKTEFDKDGTPYYYYNNQTDSPIDNKDSFMFGADQNLGILSTIMSSSEGENISIGMNIEAKYFKQFIETGKSKKDLKYKHFRSIFGDDENEEITTKERWFLFDAVDSGFSINNIINVKNLFHYIVKESKEKGYIVYVLICANAFEFANDQERCLDPVTGKYLTFKDYEDYKQYILKTFERKMKREEKGDEVLRRREEQKALKSEEDDRDRWKSPRKK